MLSHRRLGDSLRTIACVVLILLLAGCIPIGVRGTTMADAGDPRAVAWR